VAELSASSKWGFPAYDNKADVIASCEFAGRHVGVVRWLFRRDGQQGVPEVACTPGRAPGCHQVFPTGLGPGSAGKGFARPQKP